MQAKGGNLGDGTVKQAEGVEAIGAKGAQAKGSDVDDGKVKQAMRVKAVGTKGCEKQDGDTTVQAKGANGSGKSSLIDEILHRKLAQVFYRAKDTPGECDDILGIEHIDDIIADVAQALDQVT